MSKLNLLTFFLLIAVLANSQSTATDYLITIENEKIPVSVDFIRNNVKVFCDVNGKQVKYKAKKIKAIYYDGKLHAQSIRVGSGIFKRWMFAKIKVDGELKFGGFCQTKTNGGQSVEACRNFLILSSDPHGVCYKMGMTWRKNLQKAIRNCPAAITKSKELRGYYVEDMVFFYNQNCKK